MIDLDNKIWFGCVSLDPFGVLKIQTFKDFVWIDHCLFNGHKGCYWMVLE